MSDCEAAILQARIDAAVAALQPTPGRFTDREWVAIKDVKIHAVREILLGRVPE